MWKQLLLLSVIQATLFSHVSAARIKRGWKSMEDTVKVEGNASEAAEGMRQDCEPTNPAEDAAEVSYAGSNGWLIVMCDHATGLKNTDWSGKADPFCQIELQSGGSTLRRSVGLYKEDTVNGSKDGWVQLNEHTAFDVKIPKSLNQLKVKVSVRDDDDVFGNGVGTYNGGELMGSKTWSLPPRGKEPVIFLNNYRSINRNKTEVGSWKYQIRSDVSYKWVTGGKYSEAQKIPDAWEIEGKTSFDDGSPGTLAYRIRWCPYSNFDSDETKKWRQVRGTGCVKQETVFDDIHWKFNYAPACVVQGLRKFGWPSYCSGGTCVGVNTGVKTVRT